MTLPSAILPSAIHDNENADAMLDGLLEIYFVQDMEDSSLWGYGRRPGEPT